MSAIIEQAEALQSLQIHGARSRLSDYVKATYPGYTMGKFNEYLSAELDQFVADYEAGKNPRLMLFAPPRSGKSELASRRLPAMLLGRNPKLKIIAASYAASLAKKMSRDTRRIMENPSHAAIFGDSRPALKGEGQTPAEFWEVVDKEGKLTGGSYRAAGVGCGISGEGMDIGIIDDPVKDYQEAASKTIQERNIDWFDSTFMTRRNPLKNGVIIIMTRWHVGDLAGQLLDRMKNGGEQWKVISFPMVATKREIVTFKGKKRLMRIPGDILFPERMDEKFVASCKLAGALVWSALYQQSPTISGGGVFDISKFGIYSELPKFTRVVAIADTAQKTKEANDFSVFQLWGLFSGRIYLIDQIRGKWEGPELLRQARAFWAKWRRREWSPTVRLSGLYIEDKASGTGLIQFLREGGSDREKEPPVPCIAIPRDKDKFTRALDFQPSLESGLIILPDQAPFRHELLAEFEAFSADDKHDHDDQIDCALDAAAILLRGSGGMQFAGWG